MPPPPHPRPPPPTRKHPPPQPAVLGLMLPQFVWLAAEMWAMLSLSGAGAGAGGGVGVDPAHSCWLVVVIGAHSVEILVLVLLHSWIYNSYYITPQWRVAGMHEL